LREAHAKNKTVRLSTCLTLKNHVNFIHKRVFAEKEQLATIIIQQNNNKRSKPISSKGKK